MLLLGSSLTRPAAVERRPLPTPDSPLGALERWRTAYEDRDLEGYGSVFTEDFRYHFWDQDLVERWPSGWTRDDELASAQHLFEGFVNAQGKALPTAERIDIEIGSQTVSPDPEMPDSPDQYQIAELSLVRVTFHFADGTVVTDEQPHVLYLVRGDAALLGEGQVASLDRWYIRKWTEGAPQMRIASR